MNHEAKALILLVALHFGMQYEDLLGKNKQRHVVKARDIALLLARRRMGLVYSDLALLFQIGLSDAKRGVVRAIKNADAQASIRAILEKL